MPGAPRTVNTDTRGHSAYFWVACTSHLSIQWLILAVGLAAAVALAAASSMASMACCNGIWAGHGPTSEVGQGATALELEALVPAVGTTTGSAPVVAPKIQIQSIGRQDISAIRHEVFEC